VSRTALTLLGVRAYTPDLTHGKPGRTEKTRLLAFARPKKGQDRRCPATFDFLGFTHYWRKTRGGEWMMWCKTMRARQSRALRSLAEYCRSHRHDPVKEQHAALVRRIRGHFNYFGVNGNQRSLACLVRAVPRIWLKWLRRRSQRTRLSWERFYPFLERYPLPVPRISVQLWGTRPRVAPTVEPDGGNLHVRIW